MITSPLKFAGWFIAISLPIAGFGQSAADYQQAIREAMKSRQISLHEWVGPSHVYFGNIERHIGSWRGASFPDGLAPFPYSSFDLENTVEPKDFCSTLVNLQRATRNQTLQPTALLRHAYDIDLDAHESPYFRLRLPEPWLSF